jgi:ATP-dependent DNA helicase RecG
MAPTPPRPSRSRSGPPKLEALLKILEQEKLGGYQDSTVVGGLDLFLQRWTTELEPVLGPFKSYSVLTPVQRETWTEAALKQLLTATGAAPSIEGNAPQSAKPNTPAKSLRRRVKPPPASLDDEVNRLRRITEKNVANLKRLGLETVGDLVYHFPHRHIDYASIRKVSELKLGDDQTVVATVWETTVTRIRSGLWSIHTILGDDTGNIRATSFRRGSRKPWLPRELQTGAHVVASGKVNVYRGSFVLESPEFELLEGQEQLIHTGRLVPVYPTTKGLVDRTLRGLVKQALDAGISRVVDWVPEESRHRTGVIGLQSAIAQAHYPDSEAAMATARRRLAFDELLLLQLTVLMRKREWQEEGSGVALEATPVQTAGYLGALPFGLTDAQSKVLREILSDLAHPRPMSRLLQGDVGSGKTVVALAGLLLAIFHGYQGALMAPTEILAEQHFFTVKNLLAGEPGEGQPEAIAMLQVPSFPEPVTVGLLLGSQTAKAKREMHRRVAEGEVDLLIGTHALIQGSVDIPRLAMAVVDEQHRFGVMQRATIRGKGLRPHVLAMSATPIPRSLALTLYGELDVSVIDEMPPGRQKIRTRWVEPSRRLAAYGFISNQVEEGRQAFIVCPLIEESEAVQSRAAVVEHERLSTEVFPDLKLGLLHGRLALREKEQIMKQFKDGDLDILVATAVVEVGIDIPNATVMLIDGADRFGLAQLHQFRGRVGRGRHQSTCLLLADDAGADARERLKLVERINDGFELAEEDLRLRGPGDYMGTRQSGLPDLKVARITDQDILDLARQEATRLLDADPDLSLDENAPLAERLRKAAESLPGEMS